MNILIAEDDTISARLLEQTLQSWGHQTLVAEDGDTAWEIYQKEKPGLILSDWVMPGLDGLELCRRIRASNFPGTDPVYFILLTARNSVESLAAGFAAGADDYIAKPFAPEELRARVQAGLRILSLQHELVGARKKLEKLALTDSLTGMLNRRALLDSLRRDEDRMRRAQRPVGVVLADVDHFKEVNDRWGHETGDRILQLVAQCLQASVRTGDYVGRWGGEEFLLVLPDADIIQSAEIAERCRSMLETQRVRTADGDIVRVSASFGAAATEGVQRTDIMDLVQQADKAMYWAKEAGRNKVKIWVSGADEMRRRKAG